MSQVVSLSSGRGNRAGRLLDKWLAGIGVDGWAALLQGDGLCRAAIVLQAIRIEQGIGVLLRSVLPAEAATCYHSPYCSLDRW